MSVKVMGFVWDHYPNGGGELLTALALADHANHDGGDIYPSIERLMRVTRQGRSTVKRHLKKMVGSGWLEVVKRGGTGPGDTTTYRMPVTLERLVVAFERANMDPLDNPDKSRQVQFRPTVREPLELSTE